MKVFNIPSHILPKVADEMLRVGGIFQTVGSVLDENSRRVFQTRAINSSAERVLESAENGVIGTVERVADGSHLGSVGDRVKVTAELVGIAGPYFSQYGSSYLYKFKDDEGNCLVWWPKDSKYRLGTYLVSAIIKSHSEYKGEVQTVLKNCRLELVEATPIKPAEEKYEGLTSEEIANKQADEIFG